MKYHRIIALLALALMMQSMQATRHESTRFKKAARVVFHLAQTVAGYHFFNQFYRRAPRSLWPWDVMSKVWNDKWNAGSEALASITLIWYGLQGLDKELHIFSQFS